MRSYTGFMPSYIGIQSVSMIIGTGLALSYADLG